MSDAQDLHQLEAWAADALARLSDAERRKLARQVAQDLVRSQRARIAAQQNPDGSAFAPRKKRKPLRSKRGRVRRAAAEKAARVKAGAMFRKLRSSAWLGATATADEASAGFSSATAARIARVHQFGLRDKVDKGDRAPEATYPARQLLGFTEADREMLMDRLMAHLTA